MPPSETPVIRPVTPSRWKDFEALFSSKGCPGYCWCTPYRFRDSHKLDRRGRKAAMRRRIASGTPVGLLAYVGGEPVAWCSVAPRESYEKLDASHTMPRVDNDPTWTVLCFFVKRPYRDSGMTGRLLAAAVQYAAAKGGKVVEGYPFDTAGITSTHRGHSSVFKANGFARKGRRWARRV